MPVLFHFLSATEGWGGLWSQVQKSSHSLYSKYSYTHFHTHTLQFCGPCWGGAPAHLWDSGWDPWNDQTIAYEEASDNVQMAPALVVWPYKALVTWRTSHTHMIKQPAESCGAFSCIIRGTCDFRELQDFRIDVLRWVLQGDEATGSLLNQPSACNTRPTGWEFYYWLASKIKWQLSCSPRKFTASPFEWKWIKFTLLLAIKLIWSQNENLSDKARPLLLHPRVYLCGVQFSSRWTNPLSSIRSH